MYLKLALSTAVLGTVTIAFAGYANTSTTNSQHLSDIQAHSCPALVGDVSTAAFDIDPQLLILSDENNTNRLLALNAICSGYGYGGGDWQSEAVEPGRPTVAVPEAKPVPGSDQLIYFNNRPIPQTPQLNTEFDQLPQDRVELVESL